MLLRARCGTSCGICCSAVFLAVWVAVYLNQDVFESAKELRKRALIICKRALEICLETDDHV